MKRTLVLYLTALSVQLTALAQGPLTPSGAPAPTMKTLDQIEPRVDVLRLPGDVTSHVIISSAGSYYLSTNLSVTKTHGIVIAASGVTLDLNGFEIARLSGSGGDGIRINGGSDQATVRNGTIRGFSYGINGSYFPLSKGALFEQLSVTGCTTYGMYIGELSRVLDCSAINNSGSGIYAYNSSIITGCMAQGNQGSYGIYSGAGSTISGCTAFENQSNYAIYGDAGSTIRNCTARDNQGFVGIYAASSTQVSDSTAYNNIGIGATSHGIHGNAANIIIGCNSRFNGNTNSPTTASQGVGIYAGSGSIVKNCNTTFNRGDGIQVSFGCVVEGNSSYSNGYSSGDGAGIHSTSSRNRIEGNTVLSNDRGIAVDSVANLIFRNSAGGNTTNYLFNVNNVFGAIVDRTAPASAAVTGNSAASSTGTTDPWANFSY